VRITLASLDLFHIVDQARHLQMMGSLDRFFTTRLTWDRHAINRELGRTCLPLHYALRILQRNWEHLGGNFTYLQLCRAFDAWLKPRFSRQSDILTVLSGVGLHSFRAARKAGILTVVDSGSTHTDFQHEILLSEFRRNGINKPLFPQAYRDRVRTEVNEADYVQIPSRFVARTYLDRGVPEAKLMYSVYGVDHGRFKPRETLVGTEPFRAICPSGVNLRKGARVLVESWEKLNLPSAELHWIGQPDPTTEHLFKNKPDSVIFHPWMNHAELSALYRKCDVFVLPSFEEGFARVMLEAAASGLPLIATPNTGVEEFFESMQPEGFLIPAGDTEALCEALRAAATDRGRTFELGRRAATKAKNFTWEAYGARVVDNYLCALGAR
jgi:glycosyltransferase involved in cell wall biosynthesis